MSQPQNAALEAASGPDITRRSAHVRSNGVLNMTGPLPARPPFMALPTPLIPAECMALHAIAAAMATDRSDLSHTKNAVNEARSFLDIAVKRNGRNDYGAARDALTRAAAIITSALAALDMRHNDDLEAAASAHGHAIESMYSRSGR